MDFYQRYKRLTPWNKVGFWGALASIVGLIIVLLQSKPETPARSAISGDNFFGNIISANDQSTVSYNVFQQLGVPAEKYAALMTQNERLTEAIQSVTRELTPMMNSSGGVIGDTQAAARGLRRQGEVLARCLDQLNLTRTDQKELRRIVLHTQEDAPLYRLLGFTHLLEHMALTYAGQVIYTDKVYPEQTVFHFNGARNFLFTKYCLYGGVRVPSGLAEPVKQTFSLDIAQIREFVIPEDVDRFNAYSPKGFSEFLADFDSGRVSRSDVIIVVSSMANISLARDGGLLLFPNLPWQTTWLELEERDLVDRTMWFEHRNPERARESWLSVVRWRPIVGGVEVAPRAGSAPFWEHQ